jgi:hypothetical protein
VWWRAHAGDDVLLTNEDEGEDWPCRVVKIFWLVDEDDDGYLRDGESLRTLNLVCLLSVFELSG